MSAVHRFRSMGCDAVVSGGDPEAAAAVLDRWESAFSLFRDDSELSRVNRSSAPVLTVSPLFDRALEIALEMAAETGGLVDPTLCGRWPEVARSGRMLARPPGLRLDLNGVVKALAVDEAVATLDGDGFVSVGGDLAVRGAVEVALPAAGTVRVVSGGLATSGVETRGRHLVDPATGAPSRSRWRQVTVSGASCLAADVAAKAAFLLGDDGPGWLDARDMAGRFVAADGVLENETWQYALQEAVACT